MRPAFHCILNSDLITTRDNCAISCQNYSCENKDKAIKERDTIFTFIGKYSLAELQSDNPPEEIRKLIESIRANCETRSKDIPEYVETIQDMYPLVSNEKLDENVEKCIDLLGIRSLVKG